MVRTNNKSKDNYYRRAKEEGFRARSAYKLMEVDEEFSIFAGVTNAVDLCAAPGSWSQVLRNRLTGQIVSVDLQEMAPIEGVTIFQGDITDPVIHQQIVSTLDGKADLLVSDGAPDVTGLHEIDQYIQNQLMNAAFSITHALLRKGGSFVAKIFKGEDVSLIYAQAKVYFKYVSIFKPKSSRPSSVENFLVCIDFDPPEGYVAGEEVTIGNLEVS